MNLTGKNQFPYHLPWVIWTVVIIVLSTIPGNKIPQLNWDFFSPSSIAHFVMYCGLAVLMLFGFQNQKMNTFNIRVYLWVIVVGIGFGTLLEIIQGLFVYRRYFDVKDIILNSVGTIFGVIVYRLIGSKIL